MNMWALLGKELSAFLFFCYSLSQRKSGNCENFGGAAYINKVVN